MLAFLFLCMGFVLLVFGADKFVQGASALAAKLKVPPLIIGLTIVAFGTSAPELAVSLTAGIQNANEIVVGNVIGSNIFNLLMVLGASSLIIPLTAHKDLLFRDWIGTILGTILLFFLVFFDKNVSVLDGVILILSFAFITFLQVRATLKAKNPEIVEIKPVKNLLIVVYIILGLACIILGGQLCVNGATSLAESFGLSQSLISLTIVAIGTSLPELVTSVVATKRGENDIAMGNVIGSNLFNILFILGISAIFNPISIDMNTIVDITILFVASVILFIPALKNKFGRICGACMIASYIAYTAYLIIR